MDIRPPASSSCVLEVILQFNYGLRKVFGKHFLTFHLFKGAARAQKEKTRLAETHSHGGGGGSSGGGGGSLIHPEKENDQITATHASSLCICLFKRVYKREKIKTRQQRGGGGGASV